MSKKNTIRQAIDNGGIKRNVPATESGDNFLRDGSVFPQDSWIGFQIRITGSSFGFQRTFGSGFHEHWNWMVSHRNTVWFFWTLDWFFQNGQRTISDYLFAFIKIDILYTFFNILLISFALLRSYFICT